MSRKTRSCYGHLFSYIKENIFDMNCLSIATDFERAMWMPLKEMYPNVRFIKCWFHFTQAAKKRAQQTPQLIPYLRNPENSDALEIYYKLLSLPLLPASCIAEEFKILKIKARAKHRHVFDDFLSYYENQWIIKVSSRKNVIHLLIVYNLNKYLLLNHNYRKGQRIFQCLIFGLELLGLWNRTMGYWEDASKSEDISSNLLKSCLMKNSASAVHFTRF